MITYKVIQGAPGYGWFVIVRESGSVVAGPYTMREQAEEQARLLVLQTRGVARVAS